MELRIELIYVDLKIGHKMVVCVSVSYWLIFLLVI